jgi:tryptophan 2,3-dioxygenase
MTTPRDFTTPLPLLDTDEDVSRNHYWSYHNLPALLACKRPLTASMDEDLFIAVHQVCEIAFHQIVIDQDRALDALRAALSNETIAPLDETHYFLARVTRLWRTVNVTMPILTDLRAFAQFRTSIGPTSGFQSFQFRRIEIQAGVRERYWQGGTARMRKASCTWPKPSSTDSTAPTCSAGSSSTASTTSRATGAACARRCSASPSWRGATTCERTSVTCARSTARS